MLCLCLAREVHYILQAAEPAAEGVSLKHVIAAADEEASRAGLYLPSWPNKCQINLLQETAARSKLVQNTLFIMCSMYKLMVCIGWAF
jgi:hypothetical protein